MTTAGAPTEGAADPRTALVHMLQPILLRVAELRPEARSTAAAQAELESDLRHRFPTDGELVQAVGRTIAQGVADGWLCNRGDADARFSRVAKPGPTTCGLSIDVVSLFGAAVAHTHPKGEVTLGFAVPGTVVTTFDGRPPGWVFAGPGSTHTPTVAGGRMHLLYFLPDGAVIWGANP